MKNHFEDLWVKCENLHQDGDSSSTLVDELSMKLNLYKIIDQNKEIPKDDAEKIKARAMGEILLTITNISLIDNIDVYAALDSAMKFRSAQISAMIPKHLRFP